MFDLLWFVFANWCFGIRACGDANTYYAFEIQGAPNRVGATSMHQASVYCLTFRWGHENDSMRSYKRLGGTRNRGGTKNEAIFWPRNWGQKGEAT